MSAPQDDVEEGLSDIIKHIRIHHSHRIIGALLRMLEMEEGKDFIANNALVMHHQNTLFRPFTLTLDHAQQQALLEIAPIVAHRKTIRSIIAAGSVAMFGGSLAYRRRRAGKMQAEEEAASRFASVMGAVGMIASGIHLQKMKPVLASYKGTRAEIYKQCAEDLVRALEPELQRWVEEYKQERESVMRY